MVLFCSHLLLCIQHVRIRSSVFAGPCQSIAALLRLTVLVLTVHLCRGCLVFSSRPMYPAGKNSISVFVGSLSTSIVMLYLTVLHTDRPPLSWILLCSYLFPCFQRVRFRSSVFVGVLVPKLLRLTVLGTNRVHLCRWILCSHLFLCIQQLVSFRSRVFVGPCQHLLPCCV